MINGIVSTAENSAENPFHQAADGRGLIAQHRSASVSSFRCFDDDTNFLLAYVGSIHCARALLVKDEQIC